MALKDWKMESKMKMGKKVYYEMYGIGKSRYVVNFHNGIKKYNDGSDFYDIAIFKNKVELNKFIKELKKKEWGR